MRSTSLRARLGAGVAAVGLAVTLVLAAARPSPSAAQAASEPAPTVLAPVRRVLLVGDSIMNQTGPALDRQLGARYAVHNQGANGSGLLTPGVFDWPAHLAQYLRTIRPDVVVMTFIGNYTADRAELWVAEDGRRVPDVFARSFATEWGRQAELAAGQVLDAGAELVLVLPPPMISPRVQVVTDRLRAEYRRVATRWPGQVTLVDAAVALGGPDGEWVAVRRTPAGRLAPVRTADTVHLAPFGQQLEARAVRQALATLAG